MASQVQTYSLGKRSASQTFQPQALLWRNTGPEVQSRVKIRSFHLAPIFENDSNLSVSQPNWRHFEIFGDSLILSEKNIFDHFLDDWGSTPNGADFTPSVFYGYHGEENYAFKNEKQNK